MKYAITLSLSCFLLSGCATDLGQQREPSQTNAGLGPVVVATAATQKHCPSSAPGEACLVTWQQARQICEEQGGHLPTAREYVAHVRALGTLVLETAEVGAGSPPAGYYLVASVNPDGSRDAFYMNHQGYRRPETDRENYLFWTASRPPQHLQYAHVYYNEWGGGGGKPEEHLLERRNAFQCVEPGRLSGAR